MKENYNILIVDQDEELLNKTKEILLSQGFAAEICNNSFDAIEKFRTNKYHVVVIEIDMEDVDGIKLLSEFKDMDALTEIIITSKHSTMERIFISLEAGASDYILKPYKSLEYFNEIINYSIEKIERWRNLIREMVDEDLA